MKVALNIPASTAMLSAALEGLTSMSYVVLNGRRNFPPLYTSGVVYKPESVISGKRLEEWLTPDVVLARGRGDCEDLAAWRAAELRKRGIPARAVAIRSGKRKFHAVVKWPDGSIEDPSRVLGMGRGRRR